MKRQDFFYELPDDLIARYPAEERSASRLLRLDRTSGARSHHHFRELPALLAPGDLLVFNNTRVIPARLYGRKPGGGRIEILVERLTGPQEGLAHLRGGGSLKPGAVLELEHGLQLVLQGRGGLPGERGHELFRMQLRGPGTLLELLEQQGRMPLPPYIDRDEEQRDRERYQTVYGKVPGAVAAPTAGLHFDDALLAHLRERGVSRAEVTLHVGAGTFQPVRVDDLDDHRMHSEWFCVDAALCAEVAACRARGGRVIAVGTTSVRCLESACREGVLQPVQGETTIFIKPGYRFQVVDGLITNFHLPESTLLMLVSALAGRDNILAAYREAIAERYRFFSYGDAMLIV